MMEATIARHPRPAISVNGTGIAGAGLGTAAAVGITRGGGMGSTRAAAIATGAISAGALLGLGHGSVWNAPLERTPRYMHRVGDVIGPSVGDSAWALGLGGMLGAGAGVGLGTVNGRTGAMVGLGTLGAMAGSLLFNVVALDAGMGL